MVCNQARMPERRSRQFVRLAHSPFELVGRGRWKLRSERPSAGAPAIRANAASARRHLRISLQQRGVTERRAWRFGMTQPEPAKSGLRACRALQDRATGIDQSGASPVDKSVRIALGTSGRAGRAGGAPAKLGTYAPGGTNCPGNRLRHRRPCGGGGQTPEPGRSSRRPQTTRRLRFLWRGAR